MPLTYRSCHLWLVLLLAGCASVPARIESKAQPTAAQAIVLVADGAGAWQTAPRAIATAVDDLHLPLYVRSFDWTHGRGHGLADVVDYPYARCQGRHLAEEIARYRQSFPTTPIYLVGFSAGSGVALAAAEWLPTNTIERIVLLAPSVSVGYDLRRALASARQGLDVFISDRDRFWLGVGTGLVGTTDGKRDDAAGRHGFRPPFAPGDEVLAARLHQHPWDPSVAWTGNQGGHSGSLRPTYLKGFVLPLLTPAEGR